MGETRLVYLRGDPLNLVTVQGVDKPYFHDHHSLPGVELVLLHLS
jgi:hypothetical protein